MASISGDGSSAQAATEAEQGTGAAGSSAGHKRARRHALFGNYSGYYGKRRLVSSDEHHPEDAWHDVRLPVLSQCATVRQHCRNAHWLDIGCNDAQFSLLLGSHYAHCSRTVGALWAHCGRTVTLLCHAGLPLTAHCHTLPSHCRSIRNECSCLCGSGRVRNR